MTENPEDLQALLALSAKMAAAAENQAWDELSQISGEYFPLFERLSSQMSATPSRPLLQALADNEQRVRESAGPWLAATKALLDTWPAPASTDSTPPG